MAGRVPGEYNGLDMAVKPLQFNTLAVKAGPGHGLPPGRPAAERATPCREIIFSKL
jgi:hypothetical protein